MCKTLNLAVAIIVSLIITTIITISAARKLLFITKRRADSSRYLVSNILYSGIRNVGTTLADRYQVNHTFTVLLCILSYRSFIINKAMFSAKPEALVPIMTGSDLIKP